ncbi:MAG: hypothetical protein MUC36_11940 [Planctomycetes bacterium]|jgi:hypothetical protein|nr:hypothetical protein [Planctomycetota bacterium]
MAHPTTEPVPRTMASAFVLLLAVTAAAQDGEERKARPDPLHGAWLRALALGKTDKAPVLAFVLPPATAKVDAERTAALRRRERDLGMAAPESEHSEAARANPPAITARDLLLRQLQLLRLPECRPGRFGIGAHDVKPTPSLAILALTIPVVAAAERCGAAPGETVVLLGPDGRRQHGFALDLLDHDAFVQRLGKVLLDPATLQARAANVPADLARDVAALPTAPQQIFLEDNALEDRLRSRLAAAAPLLVTIRDGEVVPHPVLWLLDELRPPLGTEKPGLPYEMCTGCGMSFIPQAYHNVLQLIGP